jgi:hypothetical protein
MIQYNSKETSKKINVNELIDKYNEKKIDFNCIKEMFKTGDISSKDLGLIISETIERNTRNNTLETVPVKFLIKSIEQQNKTASVYYYKGKEKCHIIQYLDRGKALVKFENEPGYKEVWQSYLKTKPSQEFIKNEINKTRKEPDILCKSCGELGRDINFCEHCGYQRE